jgi:hypothetical protein
VIVCGGRGFSNKAMLERALDHLHAKHNFSLVIHGAYRGADTLAGSWAASRHIEVLPVPAQWKLQGKRAGPIRNAEMLTKDPELVIAFPGNAGTEDMIDQAEAAGVKVIRVVRGKD